jgi:putative endonuclease
MIECTGGGIYIGITNNVEKRYTEHLDGKGAMYTRLNPPVCLLAKREFPNRKSAAQEEYRMKRLSTLEKHQWAWALAV